MHFSFTAKFDDVCCTLSPRKVLVLQNENKTIRINRLICKVVAKIITIVIFKKKQAIYKIK